MNRQTFLAGATLLSVSLWIGCTGKEQTTASQPKSVKSSSDAIGGYWTCTMHPQVHQEGPGKCPICGMPLVHVNGHQKIEQQEPVVLEASNSQLQNAQISRHRVERQDLEISVPVSGRIVSSQQVAFQIYESDVASLKIGSYFTGSPSTSQGEILKGQVTRIDRLVDPSSRTIQAFGTLQSPASSTSIESGFYGEIQSNLKNQIVVPFEAVLFTGTRELVYVFSTDNQLQPREVQIGLKGKNDYQILSGLKEGEVISSGPNFLIDSEAKIRGR